jgi:hypothetical protein
MCIVLPANVVGSPRNYNYNCIGKEKDANACCLDSFNPVSFFPQTEKNPLTIERLLDF